MNKINRILQIIQLNIFILLISLSPLRAYAVNEKDIPCMNTGSAMDSIICTQPKSVAAEKQMQAEYDRLINELKQLGTEHLVKDLVTSQRTWLKFRREYCDVYARSRVEGNQWTTYWEASCHAKEAVSRAKTLKAMREQDDSLQ